MTKVLVIGIDGGSWNIIKPLVKRGKLPTIAKLMKNGCYGHLISTIPYVTFPAWKCYSTGKNPGKLGVYWFIEPDFKEKKFRIHTASSFRSLELWDYLGMYNITSCIIDMPTTYPPKKIKGVIVANGGSEDSIYTYPKDLSKELKLKFSYKLNPNYYSYIDKDLTIIEHKEMIIQRFEVAKYLLRKFNPSFIHVTIYPIDHIQHTYWKYMEDKHPKYGNVIEDFWKVIDDGINSLLDEFLDENSYVFLMSDHGFTSARAVFQISKWLEEKGYLVLKKSSLKYILSKLNITRDKILSILGGSKLYSLLTKILSKDTLRRIGMLFPSETIDRTSLEGIIVWEKSKIIPIPQGLLYINKDLFNSKQEYEVFRESVIEEIKKIRDPETGLKLAKVVYKGEEVYQGAYVDRAPDIVIVPNEGYEIGCSITAKEKWDRSLEKWSGMHKREGIFLAYGPHIKRNVEIHDVSIYDIMPTILHIFGIGIPKDVDGRVLTEIFEEDSVLAKEDIKYQEFGERDLIRQKIKMLKNLGVL